LNRGMKWLYFAVLASAVALRQEGPNPIRRITNLLSKMQGEVSAEGEAERKSMVKFNCACDDDIARLTQSVADNTETAKQKFVDADANTAKAAAAKAETAEATKARSSAQEEVEKANAMRKTENASFR
jgi:hypothetical protein